MEEVRKFHISKEGRRKYADSPNNPHRLVGHEVARGYEDEDWPFYIEWPNGVRNEYRDGELEEVK